MKSKYIEDNFLLKYFMYPIASIISSKLKFTKIHPTNITALWYFLLFSSIFLILTGSSSHLILIILFIIYFLDCLDGQFARDTNQTSERGKFLDDFGGDIYQVVFWIGLGFIDYESNQSILSIYASLFIVIVVLLRNSISFRLASSQTINNTKKISNSSFTLKRLIFMPFSFGELLWPITIILNIYGNLYLLLLASSIFFLILFIRNFNNALKSLS